MSIAKTPWWKGKSGEWYVVIQIILIILVFLGPRNGIGLPEWISPFTEICSVLGGILFFAGVILLSSGGFKLGRNLTPLPYPKTEATLVETGAFRIVRHPMYAGGILMAFGWAFWIHSWLTIGYAVMLFVFADVKSRREEKWLSEKYSGYGAYRKRVRKLIPFVY